MRSLLSGKRFQGKPSCGFIAGQSALYLLIISFLWIFASYAFAESTKNYVYRTKDGRILLTDQPQKKSYAELLRVFESRKELFFLKYGDYYRHKYAPLVKKYSLLNGLDPELVHAVIQVESGYDYTAVSPAGAKGLMQLMDTTADELGVQNVFDPKENIRAGTKYLAMMFDKFDGNLDLALAAYNAGPTAVALFKGVPAYKETRKYIKKINRLLGGKVIVPSYRTEQLSEEERENRRNLMWKRVDGRIIITGQPQSKE